MCWPLLYIVRCRIVQLPVLLGRGDRAKEIEILARRADAEGWPALTGKCPWRPGRPRPGGTLRRMPPTWIGLTLAFASALVTNTAYSLEHDAAEALPPLALAS